MTTRFDLVVLGGGTAGLVAAIGAAGVGARVCLVERDRTGGDCLWTGCVPSKSLLAAANLAHRMRTADVVGLQPVEPRIDFQRVMRRVRSRSAELAHHDSPERLRELGVEVIHGEGRFVRPGRVVVDTDARSELRSGRRLAYRTALVATGTRPVLPEVDGLADVDPLTTDTIWDLDELPERLVVLGGGPTGCELGQALARLGSRVTLVEMLPRLLSHEEPEAGELIADRLRDDGVDVRLATRADRIETEGDGPGGTLRVVPADDDGAGAEAGPGADAGRDQPDRIDFDRLLVATGRRPELDELGLERVGVAVSDSGHVHVDDLLRTTGKAIFAAGDVTGAPPFTHVAAYHGGLVVTNALFHLRRKVSYDAVPWATFTSPEIGRVGLTEDQARRRYGDGVVVAAFDYGDVDRAVCTGRTQGFAKLVGEPSGRLVGATVAAATGGEAIAELAAWIATGGTVDDVSQTVHTYPTFAMGPKRAADEHLRTKYLSDRTRRFTRPILGLLRLLEHPDAPPR